MCIPNSYILQVNKNNSANENMGWYKKEGDKIGMGPLHS